MIIHQSFKADGEKLRLEREAMEGFVSPESHSNVKKQLMDMKATKILKECLFPIIGFNRKCQEVNLNLKLTLF